MKIAILGSYPKKEKVFMVGPTKVTYNILSELSRLPQNKVTLFTHHRYRHFYKKPIRLQDNSLSVLKETPQSIVMRLLKQEYDVINMIGVSSFHLIPLLMKKFQGTKLVYTSVGLMLRERLAGASYAKLKSCIYERISLKKVHHIITPPLCPKRQIIQD